MGKRHGGQTACGVEVPWDKYTVFEAMGYEPHEGQKAFHDAPQRFRTLCCGSRWGKSMAAAAEAVQWMLVDGTRGWIVGPTYDLTGKEFAYVVDFLHRLKAPIKGLSENVTSGHMKVTLANGSWCECRSWHKETRKYLLGEELDWMILSEGSQCPKAVWDRYLRARLGSRMGKLVIPTTPHGYDDFLYPMFWGPARKESLKDVYWAREGPVWENPYFPAEEVALARRQVAEGLMDPLVFAEQYEGKFVAFSGKVFKDFGRDTHVVDPFDVPTEWPRWRAIDPGYADPFCCLWVACDPEGRLWVYREHYVRRQLLSWHAKGILGASLGRELEPTERFEYTVIDPSSYAARLDSGLSVAAQLAEMGLPCVPGWSKDATARIWRLSEHLRLDGGGRPGVSFFSTCPNAIREFDALAWEESNDGRNTNDRAEDRNNHAVDALGYLVMTRPRRGRTEEKVPDRSFRRYRELVSRSRPGSYVIGRDANRPEVLGW